VVWSVLYIGVLGGGVGVGVWGWGGGGVGRGDILLDQAMR